MDRINPTQIYSNSKHADKLWFSDAPRGEVAYFEHDFGNYSLEARALYNSQLDRPNIMSIHGARADFSKADPVSFGLQELGHSILGISLSGHSGSGVLLPEQTSLRNNIEEAQTFFRYLDPDAPKSIIAYSLGGTPAIKTLEQNLDTVEKLVLFYPGIYTTTAYDKPFGNEFRAAISVPYSYKDNDTISILQRFKGKLLLIKGEFDGLDPIEFGKPAGGSVGEININGKEYYSPIPKEVIDMVYGAVPDNRRAMIEIPKCDHSIILHMRENPIVARQLPEQIDQFLRS